MDATDRALNWATGKSKDEVYAFVYELFEDINYHSLNQLMEARFGNVSLRAFDDNAPVTEVTSSLSWNDDAIVEVAAELFVDAGMFDEALFLVSES